MMIAKLMIFWLLYCFESVEFYISAHSTNIRAHRSLQSNSMGTFRSKALPNKLIDGPKLESNIKDIDPGIN